jgi:hypothetical protein
VCRLSQKDSGSVGVVNSWDVVPPLVSFQYVLASVFSGHFTNSNRAAYSAQMVTVHSSRRQL